jgi:hypothetical protein
VSDALNTPGEPYVIECCYDYTVYDWDEDLEVDPADTDDCGCDQTCATGDEGEGDGLCNIGSDYYDLYCDPTDPTLCKCAAVVGTCSSASAYELNQDGTDRCVPAEVDGEPFPGEPFIYDWDGDGAYDGPDTNNTGCDGVPDTNDADGSEDDGLCNLPSAYFGVYCDPNTDPDCPLVECTSGPGEMNRAETDICVPQDSWDDTYDPYGYSTCDGNNTWDAPANYEDLNSNGQWDRALPITIQLRNAETKQPVKSMSIMVR